MSQIVKEVAITIVRKMDNSTTGSIECCIYRVPEKLRKANAEAYTPQVISIGPFHHDKTAIQLMAIKLRYLRGFLRRSKADLPACIRIISELEDCIRQCYQENLTQASEELVEMILVDAVFVVELFIRNRYLEHQDKDDEIFSKQWMSNAVFHDLLLLENQVPFFVLETLYNLTALSTTDAFFKLSYEYFKDVLQGHELASTTVQMKHLVDYVRALQLPSFPRGATSRDGKKFELIPSAKELQEAGVKFSLGKGRSSLLDVDFKDGTLVMRHVVVHEWTEPYFRNMIAYEQCHHKEKYITSYAILMDSLIDTSEDIDILISCGILENRLGSKEDVASLFNSLYKETMRDSSEFLYSSLCQSLNECHPRSRVFKLVKEVAVNLKTNMDTLPDVSIGCCIYRVPEKLCRANAEAYTPQVISIGPFHRDKSAIQLMAIKLRYLTGFLRRSKADLPACIRIISELEDRIRQCYQENLTQASKELVEIILVDAVFVVELFIRNHFPEHRDEDDEIFSKQWTSDAVFRDILLLENQVPFFVLENLYNLTVLSTNVTFFKLSDEYFKYGLQGQELGSTRFQVNHLVAYVRAMQRLAFQRPMTSRQDKKFHLTRSAKELQEAGVEFRRMEPGKGISSLLNVDFKAGTLMMQYVVVYEWTEAWFSNMIAYEQCHHEEKYITSYAILMDSLINTPEDIDILISCGILENRLGSKEDMVSLFNSLYKETMRDSSEFLYSNLFQKLNEYSRAHRWRAILNRDYYFSKPWFRISAVGGGVLFVLTIVQTACSLMDAMRAT